MNIPLPQGVFGWIAIAAFILSALLFVRRNDINGIKDANDELRKRLDDKDKENKDLQKQLNSFKEDLAHLKGILQEKDKTIETLTKVQVIQQSNPELLTYMQDVRNFMSHTQTWMLATTQMLTELNQRSKSKTVEKNSN